MSCSPEAEKLVNEKLQSGEYQTPAEIVEEALQLRLPDWPKSSSLRCRRKE